jgi:hypothetical protein
MEEIDKANKLSYNLKIEEVLSIMLHKYLILIVILLIYILIIITKTIFTK